jgi:hypothetical protein
MCVHSATLLSGFYGVCPGSVVRADRGVTVATGEYCRLPQGAHGMAPAVAAPDWGQFTILMRFSVLRRAGAIGLQFDGVFARDCLHHAVELADNLAELIRIECLCCRDELLWILI